ncbi:hypothetical protein [Spirillospora sp. NPDC029432]|uniref:hypothetical protein n=1 Tax=Spirillospora sp. NPDC029432 TaxID=3154599 RepID=UPI00345351C5
MRRSRQRRLSEAQERIALIEQYLNVNKQASFNTPNKEMIDRAARDLEQAYLSVSNIERKKRFSRKFSLETSKAFLLLGRVHSRPGSTLRVAYYAVLFWAFVGAAALWAITFEQGLNFSNVATSILTLLLVGILPAWAVYALTLKVDRVFMQRKRRYQNLKGASKESTPDLPSDP